MNFATPAEVEGAFYAAFEAHDLRAMTNVWADDDAITCIHPMGGPMTGPAGIMESFAHLFREGPPLRFRISPLQRSQGPALAVHIVYEHVHISGQSGEQRPMVATNAYQLGKNGWRMLLHHASPVPDLSQPERRARMH